MSSGEEILDKKILRLPPIARMVMRVISDLLMDQRAFRAHVSLKRGLKKCCDLCDGSEW
jgi:hypothetical protein